MFIHSRVIPHRQTQRQQLGAQTDGKQQDDIRNEAAERFHVPSCDGRPRRRDQSAVQPAPTAGAAQQFNVPVDRARGHQRQGREKGHERMGVRNAGGGRGQADVVQTIAGRWCVLGRTTHS